MALIVVLVIVVLLIAYIVATYNKFVKMANKVEEAFSTMDVYLKKRYDLIPNLIETIKGYTKHEAETLEKVISARNMAVQAQSMDEKIQTEKNFQSMLGPLYAISEQYPNLKADQHFTELQKELQKIETEIANSRKFYNAVCVKFNNLVEMFPSNLLAQMFHQTKKPLYEIENVAQRENVKVQF
ncbi:MAG: LemA family protein [Longicatena sp.]